MNAKDLIKEIDPDYTRCYYCNRQIHKDSLRLVPVIIKKVTIMVYECLNGPECMDVVLARR